jgi:hypothetical protein
MQNIQHRLIDAPAEKLGTLLDQMATPDDRVWPAPAWSRLVLDAGLTPGSRGGHGLIRYSVAEYEPGRRIRFSFEPGLGLDGYHELLITTEGPNRCRLAHTIAATVEGRMRLLWPLMIRWMHEALLQDLLDNAEHAATGRLRGQRSRWSLWVRLLRRARGFPAVRAESPTDMAGLH